MAALTAARDTVEISNGARHLVLPVKGNTTIYQGALVALDASGYAVPGSKSATLTAAGRAEETVANTGADGAATIRVARGVFVFENATDAGKLTAAHVLSPATSRTTRPSPPPPPARAWPVWCSGWTTRASPWSWASA